MSGHHYTVHAWSGDDSNSFSSRAYNEDECKKLKKK